MNKIEIFLVFIIVPFTLAINDCLTKPEPKLVKSNGGYYILTPLMVFEGSSPTELRYFNGDAFFSINSESYVLRKDAQETIVLKYKIKSDSRNMYVDDWGTRVTSSNGMTIITKSTNRQYKVIAEKRYYTSKISVDIDKNRIFLIGYESKESKIGGLFTFMTKDLDIAAGRVFAEEIKDVGDRISAISVDRTSGKIILAIQITDNKWSLTTMENINKETCKVAPKNLIYKDALKMAIKIAGEEIIKLYEDAVSGYDEPEILKEANYNTTKPPDAICGKNHDEMKSKLNQLNSRLKGTNDRFDNLYLMIFGSKNLKIMQEFVNSKEMQEVVALDTNNVRDKSKKYVTLLESDFELLKNMNKNMTEFLKHSVKWLERVKNATERSNFIQDPSLESVMEPTVQLDVRFKPFTT